MSIKARLGKLEKRAVPPGRVVVAGVGEYEPEANARAIAEAEATLGPDDTLIAVTYTRDWRHDHQDEN